MTTIELSTIMPSTTISAASVTVLSGMPQAYISPTEMKVERGMVMAATTAERHGKRNIITTMMMAMATNRSRRNDETESPTTFASSAMRATWTSDGSTSSVNAWSTWSTSRPYSTMLYPSRISIESSTQRWPLLRM